MREYPLPKIRRLRALLQVSILLLAVLLVVMSAALVALALRKPVAFGPTTTSLTATSTGRQLTDRDVTYSAISTLLTLETWTYATVAGVPDKARPLVYPKLQSDLRTLYAGLATTAARARLLHSIIPGEPKILQRTMNDFAIAIPYRETNWVSAVDGEVQPAHAVRKVALMELVIEVPNDENPTGLLLSRYITRTRDEWLKASPNNQNFWADEAAEIRVEEQAAALRAPAK